MKPHISSLYLLLSLALSGLLPAAELEVATTGDNSHSGAKDAPLRTIQRAADLAKPGDTITVHAGVYRERITPPRGGESDAKRIVYQAAPGEKVEIKGSEIAKGWEKVDGSVWKVTLPNSLFGSFNPYSDLIRGDWFNNKKRPHHTGAVYLNGDWLVEAASMEDLFKEPKGKAKPDAGYLYNLAWFAIGANTEAKRIPAAGHSASAGVQPTKLAAAAGVEGEGLGWIKDGAWARYDNLSLNGATTLSFQVSSASSGGVLEARADSPEGKLLGSIDVKPTGDWGKWMTLKMALKPLPGAQSLCLRFRSTLVPGSVDPLWFAKVEKENTTIWAQFKEADPNEQLVEINVRQAVFYPEKTGINYLTVRGFDLQHAATPWAPPTAEQIGLIGTHWSKGWIIENNSVSYSICSGITLGKYGDEFDNKAGSAEGYVGTIKRATANGWNGETIGHHVVRGNTISHCEQTGICGSLGAIFSVISDNTIHDIHVRGLFGGAEMAGIKIHGAIDTEISRNRIYRSVFGIWLDWMAQGTQITRNLLYDNGSDLFLEVNHGPFLVANNIFLSSISMESYSQGGAFFHNLFAGNISQKAYEGRKTPYMKPHSTEVLALNDNPSGDYRFINNIFVKHGTLSAYYKATLPTEVVREIEASRGNLSTYDKATLPMQLTGNVFFKGTTHCAKEQDPVMNTDADPELTWKETNGVLALQMTLKEGWAGARNRPIVTTKLLGTTAISKLPFVQFDGSPVRVSDDYFGKQRSEPNPAPGPFKELGLGTQIINL
jgi:hypothetical protein